MYKSLVGYIVNDDRNIVEVFGELGSADEVKELYYNNDIYGIVCATGFVGLQFESIADSSEERLEEIKSLITSGVRGACQGVVMLKGGLFLIKDASTFNGVIQPSSYGAKKEELYNEWVDVSDIEEGDYGYTEIAEIMNVIYA